ncbi:MAG: DUF2950 domain-containing protein [Verrucomicrobia bacterium]|nr:DUF2950 domain-containing protein [Verrucomicrobiota bacterium]
MTNMKTLSIFLLRKLVTIGVAITLTLGASAAEQTVFSSAEEALNGLTAAVKARDTNQLAAIFGPSAGELSNPDSVQAARELEEFAKLVASAAVLDKCGDTNAILLIGSESWPFPVPMVRRDGSWLFDTLAGKEEIINCRIGENELTVIGVCRAYLDAQRRYACQDRDGDEVREFAQELVSSEGRRDGLYWPPVKGEELSPFGPLAADAQAEGYKGSTPARQQPFHGYFLKILTRQGKHAPGGKHDYIINGNMIAGFALVAWPAQWNESDVMSFIVNQQGKVFQKNLGPQTATIASRMKAYDPDGTWSLVRE